MTLTSTSRHCMVPLDAVLDVVQLGLGSIVALYCRSSTAYQIC
jgi:hypothetical protein